LKKKFALFAAVVALAFLVACGGGGPANPGTGASGFTNGTFKGSYVFTMNGECVSCSTVAPMHSVGVMVADGNGNITSGSWDVNIGGADQTTSITGTYSVTTDGKASVTLNETGLGATDSFVLMLNGTGGGYIVSADSTWALSGVVELRAAVPTTTPTGKYVFRASGLDSSNNAQGIVGEMDLNAGTLVADMNNNGTITSVGTATVASSSYDSTMGRGVLTVTSTSSLPSMSFAYYVVDAGIMEIVSDDPSNGMQGRVEPTGGVVASGNVLLGSFAFMASGYPVTGNIQVNEAGILTGDGAGNITSGSLDTIFDTSNILGAALTGTGSVSTAGGVTRDVLTLSAAGSTISMTRANVWLSSAGRGFFLTTTSDRAETGTVNLQTGAPFTDGGTFGLYVSGWVIGTGVQGLNSASVFKNSSGTVSGYSQELNIGGTPGFGTGTGTLSFDGTGTIGSLTLNNSPLGGASTYRIYQYSSANGFIMETDGGIIAAGEMSAQTAQ
jgi:fibronectin-binding autotransporter adhesin